MERLAEDCTHWIFFCQDLSGWNMLMGHPQASWLHLVESYLKDMARHLPGQWPEGVLSEGYEPDRLGICLCYSQMEAYLKDMGMTGLTSAWVMARRRPI